IGIGGSVAIGSDGGGVSTARSPGSPCASVTAPDSSWRDDDSSIDGTAPVFSSGASVGTASSNSRGNGGGCAESRMLVCASVVSAPNCDDGDGDGDGGGGGVV